MFNVKNLDTTEQSIFWLAFELGLLDDMQEESLSDLFELDSYQPEHGIYISIDGGDYLLCEDLGQAELVAKSYIQDSLWAFIPAFLAEETGLPVEAFEAIQANGLCESNTSAIFAMIEGTCGLDSFVQAAIGADGLGHFLAAYDGNELELKNGALAFRTN